MKLRNILLAALLFSAGNSFAQSESISDIKANNKQFVLNEKAAFLFPEKAIKSARVSNIMGPDPNENSETRLMLDIDKMRLVFFAEELFAFAGDDLFAKVSKNDGTDFKSRVLTNKDSLLSILSTPSTFDSLKKAILVNSLLVRTQDNSIFRINAYINPEGLKRVSEFQELSEKVFASLSKGTRSLNYKARTETLPVFDSEKKFIINLPQGFIITKDNSHDFEVLRFQQVKDIADTNWAALTIYTGRYPSYFYGEYGLEESNAENIKGQAFGKDVSWLSFKNTEKHFYLKEQKIPFDESGLTIHIAMMGNTADAIDSLTKIIESIKVADK